MGCWCPAAIRDSLYILDAIHRLDATEPPEIIITDTASYSDIVYGLFAICGYQFAPRIADVSDTQLWWIDPARLSGNPTGRSERATDGAH